MVTVLPLRRTDPSIHILNIYCPPKTKHVNFADLLSRALSIAGREPLLIVGDFNAPSKLWGYKREEARGRKKPSLGSVVAAHGSRAAGRTSAGHETRVRERSPGLGTCFASLRQCGLLSGSAYRPCESVAESSIGGVCEQISARMCEPLFDAARNLPSPAIAAR
ncbi:hypothetical protein HPB49_011553 [Dermacentor silvarum]|uniref:Uncharacterized protein n=1 Tax=Dermacentor silvarum TaxID=543639 RepID=A0ACB8D570_DERSI|nr:hypothetical protein HPB49_011553 [Dermacentor silvarum]